MNRTMKNVFDETQYEVTARSGTNWSNPNHRMMAYLDGFTGWSRYFVMGEQKKKKKQEKRNNSFDCLFI